MDISDVRRGVKVYGGVSLCIYRSSVGLFSYVSRVCFIRH
jgi:hypothetical protein